MKSLRRIGVGLGWGTGGGLAMLALEQAIAAATLGFPIPLAPRFALAYGLSGALCGALASLGIPMLGRRQSPGVAQRIAAVIAILHTAPIFERVDHASRLAGAGAAATLVAAAAVVLFGAWIVALRRILLGPPAGGDGVSRFSPTTGAFVVASLSAALVLAVNRNLVADPLGVGSLATDAAIAASALAVALALRRAGRRPVATAAVVLAFGLILGLAFLAPRRDRSTVAEATEGRPHLLLLVVDTLRQDVFRSVVETTEEGLAFRRALGPAAWFDRAIAAAPWTAPSVATLLTGLFPPEHGFGVERRASRQLPLTRLPRSVRTLAEELTAAGYATLGLVANPLLYPASGVGRGFERYELLTGPTSKLPLLTALAAGGLLRSDFYQEAAAVRRRLEHHLPELTAERRPLFLWLHLMDPHYPLHRRRGLSADPLPTPLPPQERLYRDEVRYALAELARILETLAEAGLLQRAVTILVADHGEMLPSDGHHHLPPGRPKLYGHGHALYDELVRVPLVIRPAGGLPADRRIDTLVSHADLHGTIGQLLGVPLPPQGTDRVSLVPWLQPAPPPRAEIPDRAFTVIGANQIGPPQRAVRTPSFKYIQYLEGDLPHELYRLDRDPGELRDLASTDPSTAAELREVLELFWGQLAPTPEGAEPLAIDEETRQRLEALGYL